VAGPTLPRRTRARTISAGSADVELDGVTAPVDRRAEGEEERKIGATSGEVSADEEEPSEPVGGAPPTGGAAPSPEIRNSTQRVLDVPLRTRLNASSTTMEERASIDAKYTHIHTQVGIIDCFTFKTTTNQEVCPRTRQPQ